MQVFTTIHHKAKVVFHDHKKHCLGVMTLSVLIVHYVAPSFEAHATCIVGFICTELSA